MVMRGAKRKGVRYFGPYGHAYAIRETLDLLLRTFPIRTCSDNKFDRHAAARPAVPAVPHREVRRARASARSTTERVRRARRRAARRSSTATPTPVVERLEKQMHEAADDARVRAGGPAARPARPACARRSRSSRWSAERNEDFDVHRHRRGRARGVGAGVLRAQGPGGRAARASSSTRSRTSRPASWSAASLERLYDERRRRASPRRCWCRVEPEDRDAVRGVADRSCGARKVDDPGAAAGRQARRCSRPSPGTRKEEFVAPPAAAGHRPQHAGPRRSTSCRTRSACPRRRCASSATT